MKSLQKLATASATGVVIAATVATPVFACHPQGKIVKTVQDVTTSSAMADANTSASAPTVNKGDILTYTITVSNRETQVGAHGEDQMVSTKLTDTLPAGVELVANPSETTITENLGNIKAKGSVTRQYKVKVTSDTDGALLTNKACYKSTSNLGSKYNQNGCDVAIVKVHVPVTPTPAPTPTPTKPTPTPQQPTVLPNTGAGNLIVPAALLSILGYAVNVLRLKFRAQN